MICKLSIYESTSVDPYFNLATEKYLLDSVDETSCILYLWQNQNTVVIGKNQNAWAECRTSLLQEEGGKLARRLSGGGAVFHDLGNLNFTFLVGRDNYDLTRQLAVIQKACAFAGIETTRSGRNDILADGRKFSGNAFYHSGTCAYHHGTLLIDSDMEKLQRYLSPSKAKLEAKGVCSVRSRVINLKELSAGLTCQTMKDNMKKAFCDVYGLCAETITLTDEALSSINKLGRSYADWNYLYGAPLPFSFCCESRFDWGGIELQLQAKSGIITAAKVYSDAMDWQLPSAVENALVGCRFTQNDIKNALNNILADSQIIKDLCDLIDAQEL